VKELSAIALSRPRDDGKRFIAIGGKSEPQVIQVNTTPSDVHNIGSQDDMIITHV